MRFTHEVVAAYQFSRYEQNQVISRHTSYELARKAAKRAGDDFTRIREAQSGFRMAKPGAAEVLTRGRY